MSKYGKTGIDWSIPIDNNPRWQTYEIWKAMKQRCSNPNATGYKNYGGRGVTVCDEWKEPIIGFTNFVNTVGERPSTYHTIDRIDPDGNYDPDNTKWATYLEQNNNKREKPDAGIHYVEKNDNWQSHIGLFSRKIHLGTSSTKEEALKLRAGAQVVKDKFIELGLYSNEYLDL
jgi:hypothetical protein